MVVGDVSVFAIESSITKPYPFPGHLGLGFFILHVAGASYGVRAPDATLLACSFDAVRQRIARRGEHRVHFGAESSARKIVESIQAALYDMDRQSEFFFGMSADELQTLIASHHISWAPDGDEAFDDGSHVLQFDQGDQVRLIAFKNRDDSFDPVREVWMNGDAFYGLLDEWHRRFEAEWALALKLEKR